MRNNIIFLFHGANIIMVIKEKFVINSDQPSMNNSYIIKFLVIQDVLWKSIANFLFFRILFILGF